MPTPAEMEARFARLEGHAKPPAPSSAKRKGPARTHSTAAHASSIDEDELEESRKQAEKEAKRLMEREAKKQAEREARWVPGAAPVPKQLQAGERARMATLQRSTEHNTTSAKENARRPIPQCFAAPTSPPPLTPLPSFPFSISSPAAKATQNEDFLWSKSRGGDGKSVPPLEQPRRAPQPPNKRPPGNPLEDFWASPVESSQRKLSDSQHSNISAPAPSVPLPHLPIPQQQQKPVRPLGPHVITGQEFTSTTIYKSPHPSPSLLFSYAAVNGICEDTKSSEPLPRSQAMPIRGRQSSSETPSSRPFPMIRSSTAPPAFNRKARTASRRTASSSSTRHTRTSRFGRKDPGTGRSSLDAHRRALKTTTSIKSALSVIDDLARFKNVVSKPSATPGSSASSRSPGIFKRSGKGETMSMLVDTGFFPVEELIYGKDANGQDFGTVSKLRQSQMYRINLPPRLSLFGGRYSFTGLRSPNGSLGSPDSPTDGLASPLSPGFARRSWGARNRRSGVVRSPLTQVSENKVGSMMEEEEDGGEGTSSPSSTLAVIAEGPDDEENIPPEIGSAMPVAREIHLRGGSVVTVTPPEMTAWRCSVYLHGAIKLPKPVILPRKNSVATLEPFQEMVDDVYQHALAVPRRRSDDAVVDDICDFFDEFGFEVNIIYDGDRLGAPDISFDEAPEFEGDGERFRAPPFEPSPLEINIAKEVLDIYPMVQPTRRPPPVETGETLRARGKARLSKGSMASS